jgi:hypothetical protein
LRFCVNKNQEILRLTGQKLLPCLRFSAVTSYETQKTEIIPGIIMQYVDSEKMITATILKREARI